MHSVVSLLPNRKKRHAQSNAFKASFRAQQHALIRHESVLSSSSMKSMTEKTKQDLLSNRKKVPIVDTYRNGYAALKAVVLDISDDLTPKRSYRTIGPVKYLSLCPLTNREYRDTCKWRNFNCKLPDGCYKVAPDRASIQIFESKFWIYRHLRVMLKMMIDSALPLGMFKEQLGFVRTAVMKYLHTGVRGQLSPEQRKLSATVFWCHRHMNNV